MKAKKIVFKGTGKPLSKQGLSKLKKNIERSEKQTKEDSKVELKVLVYEFNY